MILTEQDIQKLTKAKQHAKQRQELEHLRIPYKVRRDGSLVVILSDARVESLSPEPEMYS